MAEIEHIGSVAMGDSTPEWRYEIKHGPQGEANYAWLYHRAEMVAVMKTHDAIALMGALARPAQEPVAWVSENTIALLGEMSKGASNVQISNTPFKRWTVPLYAAPQPTHGTSATERVANVDAVKIARDFGDEELRGTSDFIRGAAYASESIALAIEDANRSALATPTPKEKSK